MSDDVKAIRAIVTIACDRLYRIKSSHMLLGPQDQAVAAEWPSGGQSQLAHGLLFEAARREAVISMLLCLQKDENWLRETADLDDAQRTAALKAMAEKVLDTMSNTLTLIVEDAVSQTYREMVKPSEMLLNA